MADTGIMSRHSNATTAGKDISLALANVGTFGLASVADKTLFKKEQKRIDALNKKVIQNCIDIKNIASILQDKYELIQLTEEELLNIVNITRRSGDETCENSLNYDTEMDVAKNTSNKFREKLSSGPKMFSNSSEVIAAAQNPVGSMLKQIELDELKIEKPNISPPVSRPVTPEYVDDSVNEQESSSRRLFDFDRGATTKKTNRKSKRKSKRKTKKKSKKSTKQYKL